MPKIILCEDIPKEQAEVYCLVLSASNIPCGIAASENGWNLWVDEFHYEKAFKELLAYRVENPAAAEPTASTPKNDAPLICSLLASLVILSVHAFLSVLGDYPQAIRQYGAAADKILDGEIYRTFTALLLHANAAHLLGNMAGLILFGTAVGTLTGAVRGWGLILLSGVLGNFINALMFQSHHLSIGASTAVFGAVGILSAHQFFRKFRSPVNRKKAWLSLAGGMALLGFLGTGEKSDVTAHLFGFIIGAILGLFSKAIQREKSKRTADEI